VCGVHNVIIQAAACSRVHLPAAAGAWRAGPRPDQAHVPAAEREEALPPHKLRRAIACPKSTIHLKNADSITSALFKDNNAQ
jgi:hypothetical protein